MGIGRSWDRSPFSTTSSGPVLPLDLISGSVAAYSLRKLRTAYAGKACNIRRTSDNATQDIGFAGVDFDVAAFSAFIGGSSGFARIWYDQSGNAYDASDFGFSNQPQLVLAATPTGQPALSSLSTNGLGGTVPAVTTPLTLSSVVSRTGTLTSFVNCFVLSGAGGNPSIFYISSPGMAFGGSDSITKSGITDNQFHSAIGVMNGASSSLTVDGITTNGTLTNGPGSTAVRPVAYAMAGLTCEAIYFNGALSAADIAALYAGQKVYWGTP